ncbi:MAG: cyclopropane fatty acyl phospholipid synthase [Candidatus Nanoarchaeia archaeon]|nr:cyclopropane fatty acyl phospholipid synthase [Candidatus Nanoarchaeia archaeon]
MAETSYEKTCREILGLADIQINGNRPWDIKVNNPELYKRILSQGSLGLGESYMDGWWDCKAIDEFINRIFRAELDKKVKNLSNMSIILKAKLTNPQRRDAFDIGKKHYDTGNDLFSLMLDKRMVYTCAYWENAKNLDSAQENKLRLTCEKLKLKPGMKVLDIGCGWGSFLKYAAEKYGIKGVGITVSKEQVELGNQLCKGLDVEIRYQDYEDLDEKFDRIVSLGMFEHVGHKNFRKYMEIVNKCLNENGLFLLHTIGSMNTRGGTDPWLNKYIFPNGFLPSLNQIIKSSENLFILEDLHNFSVNYDKTLIAWHHNFIKSWDKLKEKYPERFKRMWEYYLLSCAGAFRARNIQIWQIVFSKGRILEYKSIR